MRGGHGSWHYLLPFCLDGVDVVGYVPGGSASHLYLSLCMQLDM